MNCPSCQTSMELKKGTCQFGTEVILHQCPKCGGLWGDRHQFYRVDPAKAAHLVEVNEEKFEKKVPSHGAFSCPRCSERLKILQDPFIPDDIDLEVCPKCGGIWTNAGTFLRYNLWRGKKIASLGKQELSKESQALAEKIEDLAAIYHHKERKRMETIGKIGRFLSKRVHPLVPITDWKEHEKRWIVIIWVTLAIAALIVSKLIPAILGR